MIEDPGTRRGFMCKIDFDYELGNATGGSRVYSSVSDLLREHDCAHECGIVEVEVRLAKIIEKGSLP